MILFAESVALAIIAWHAACGLNHMSRATHKPLVLVVCLVFAGSVARALCLIAGHAVADASTALLLLAFAGGMLIERRRSDTCPCLPNFCRGRHEDHGGITT